MRGAECIADEESYLFMSLTAARPRTPTPKRSTVPGSGVATVILVKEKLQASVPSGFSAQPSDTAPPPLRSAVKFSRTTLSTPPKAPGRKVPPARTELNWSSRDQEPPPLENESE